jgi:hypothetical protein
MKGFIISASGFVRPTLRPAIVEGGVGHPGQAEFHPGPFIPHPLDKRHHFLK